MDAKEVGTKLVEYCRRGANLDAIDTLYDENVVSVEASGNEAIPAEMRGIDAIRGKNQWWLDNHEIHSASADGPFPNGDRFTVIYDYDVTAKAGQAAGQRYKMHEVALYEVKDGKIVREDFFYDM